MANDSKRESILNRVKGMMRVAGDVRTPVHEAQAAATMVAKLIAQYQIEDAELRATQKKAPSEITRFEFEVSNKLGLGKERSSALHWAVIAPLGGTSYKTSRTSTKLPTTLVVFLPGNIVDFAKVLMISLILQMEQGMRDQAKQERARLEEFRYLYTPAEITKAVNSFRRAYVLGFGTTVAKRIEAGQKEAVQDAVQDAKAEAYAHGVDGEELAKVGSEIALMDTSQQADQAMADFYAEMYGEDAKLGKGRRYKITNRKGYHAGQQDGENADIANKRIGGSRKAVH